MFKVNFEHISDLALKTHIKPAFGKNSISYKPEYRIFLSKSRVFVTPISVRFSFLFLKALLRKTQTFPTNFTGKVKSSSFMRLKKQFLEEETLLHFTIIFKLKLYSHKVSTFIFTFFVATKLAQFPLKGNIYSEKKNPQSRFCL